MKSPVEVPFALLCCYLLLGLFDNVRGQQGSAGDQSSDIQAGLGDFGTDFQLDNSNSRILQFEDLFGNSRTQTGASSAQSSNTATQNPNLITGSRTLFSNSPIQDQVPTIPAEFFRNQFASQLASLASQLGTQGQNLRVGTDGLQLGSGGFQLTNGRAQLGLGGTQLANQLGLSDGQFGSVGSSGLQLEIPGSQLQGTSGNTRNQFSSLSELISSSQPINGLQFSGLTGLTNNRGSSTGQLGDSSSFGRIGSFSSSSGNSNVETSKAKDSESEPYSYTYVSRSFKK